jgi:hypothetical protein
MWSWEIVAAVLGVKFFCLQACYLHEKSCIITSKTVVISLINNKILKLAQQQLMFEI